MRMPERVAQASPKATSSSLSAINASQSSLREIFLYESQQRLHQRFARISILRHEYGADRRMRARDRHGERPMIGVDVRQQVGSRG